VGAGESGGAGSGAGVRSGSGVDGEEDDGGENDGGEDDGGEVDSVEDGVARVAADGEGERIEALWKGAMATERIGLVEMTAAV
jgi:hypothetical protein